MEFSVVTPEEALQDPYPYIFVEKDGSWRELSVGERDYLETPFHGADGGRPYIKRSYEKATIDGDISGFMARKLLPES